VGAGAHRPDDALLRTTAAQAHSRLSLLAGRGFHAGNAGRLGHSGRARRRGNLPPRRSPARATATGARRLGRGRLHPGCHSLIVGFAPRRGPERVARRYHRTGAVLFSAAGPYAEWTRVVGSARCQGGGASSCRRPVAVRHRARADHRRGGPATAAIHLWLPQQRRPLSRPVAAAVGGRALLARRCRSRRRLYALARAGGLALLDVQQRGALPGIPWVARRLWVWQWRAGGGRGLVPRPWRRRRAAGRRQIPALAARLDLGRPVSSGSTCGGRRSTWQSITCRWCRADTSTPIVVATSSMPPGRNPT
jgi:hypothetical protein